MLCVPHTHTHTHSGENKLYYRTCNITHITDIYVMSTCSEVFVRRHIPRYVYFVPPTLYLRAWPISNWYAHTHTVHVDSFAGIANACCENVFLLFFLFFRIRVYEICFRGFYVMFLGTKRYGKNCPFLFRLGFIFNTNNRQTGLLNSCVCFGCVGKICATHWLSRRCYANLTWWLRGRASVQQYKYSTNIHYSQ